MKTTRRGILKRLLAIPAVVLAGAASEAREHSRLYVTQN